MTTARLEHINISVTDPQRTATLLETLTGWHRRWKGPAMNDGYTIHLGDEASYIAIYSNAQIPGNNSKGLPLNHIGILVANLAEVERTIVAAGLIPFNHGNYAPGRRFYVMDWDGIEWEFVSYE